MDNRKLGVYPTQDTSRMETAKMKKVEKADTRIIAKVGNDRNLRGYEERSPKQGLDGAN